MKNSHEASRLYDVTVIVGKTRMTTFIKTKFKISDLESPSNFQVKEKKLFKSVQKQRNWTVVVRTVIWGKYNIGF